MKIFKFLNLGAVLGAMFLFHQGMAQGNQTTEVRNWLPTAQEQEYMFNNYRFAVQERIEVQYTAKGDPMYRFALCQYRKRDDGIVLFNDSQDHRSYPTYDKYRQNSKFTYRYKDANRLYREGECLQNGLCEDDMQFIRWIENNDHMDGSWIEKGWLHDNSLFIKDEAQQLNCFYYLNGEDNHMQDYFLTLHPSMDDLFSCIENDAWFKGSVVVVGGIFLVSRYPGISKHFGKLIPRGAIQRVFAKRASIQILNTYRPLLLQIEKALISGRYNPLQYSFMQKLSAGIFSLAADGIVFSAADHSLQAIGGDVYTQFKQNYVQGWVEWGADLLLDFIMGPPRHFGGLDQAASMMVADGQSYTSLHNFQRVNGENHGLDYSRLGAWDENKNHSIIEFMTFKKRIFSGSCALNKVLDYGPTDFSNLDADHEIHKILRQYKNANQFDNQKNYIELYYGYYKNLIEYAGYNTNWKDSFKQGPQFILPNK